MTPTEIRALCESIAAEASGDDVVSKIHRHAAMYVADRAELEERILAGGRAKRWLRRVNLASGAMVVLWLGAWCLWAVVAP